MTFYYDMRREVEAFASATGVRDDWHEPDEKSVSARVVGQSLDNAFGTQVTVDSLIGGYQEIVILLEDGMCRTPPVKLNLASLLADYVRLIKKDAFHSDILTDLRDGFAEALGMLPVANADLMIARIKELRNGKE